MRSLAITIVALFALVGAAPAFADVITGTVSGTVSSGTDSSNYFGGGNLTGDAISISFTYDTSIGSLGSGFNQEYFNGSAPGSLSIATTINGDTVTTLGGNIVFDLPFPPFQQEWLFQVTANDTNGSTQLSLYSSASTANMSLDNQTALNLILAALFDAEKVAFGSETIYLTGAAPASTPEPDTFMLTALFAAGFFIARRTALIR